MISFQAILRKHILNPKDLSEKRVAMERTSGQKVPEGFSEASWSLSHKHSLTLPGKRRYTVSDAQNTDSEQTSWAL